MMNCPDYSIIHRHNSLAEAESSINTGHGSIPADTLERQTAAEGEQKKKKKRESETKRRCREKTSSE